jgi:hypothetical protein
MSIFLEITQLDNGDVVLREARDEQEETEAVGVPRLKNIGAAAEPLVRIRFSSDVKDMLGDELVGVAEAMIDAATDYLDAESLDPDSEEAQQEAESTIPPVIH